VTAIVVAGWSRRRAGDIWAREDARPPNHASAEWGSEDEDDSAVDWGLAGSETGAPGQVLGLVRLRTMADSLFESEAME